MKTMTPMPCLVLLLLWTSPVIAQGLAGEALLETFSGKSLSLSCNGGASAVGRYSVRNNIGILSGTYKAPNKPASKEVGLLRAAGDQLCLTFHGLDDGAERCFGVVQSSPSTFTFTAVGGLVNACEVIVS